MSDKTKTITEVIPFEAEILASLDNGLNVSLLADLKKALADIRLKRPPKTITAKESARRGQHFWDAFNGMTVKINHQRFPDGIFELTYRKRQACFSDEHYYKGNCENAGDLDR